MAPLSLAASIMAEPRNAPVQGDQPTANTAPSSTHEKKPFACTCTSGRTVLCSAPMRSTPM